GHILVVDDNAMVLRNIKGVLDEKYSVAVAPSGVHAFISIGKKMPDLILLDYEMPEMNGKQVLEKLQADEELKDIPVVFLTSMDSKEIVMSLLALKPAGYLLKPVDSQMLKDKIYEIIGK
ncbi:MAG: response regulator, partial [Lachnospiraceae bacterium]|nr:response regulator [Lachnospiraceae bacterium]MBP3578488.1 response regulator [Lachnospiraceae bacterium]